VPNLLGFYRFIVLLLVLVGRFGERCLLRSHLVCQQVSDQARSSWKSGTSSRGPASKSR
jgi:hypothetical protein